MKKEVTKSVAKGMKAALDVVLRTEANTASCLIGGGNGRTAPGIAT